MTTMNQTTENNFDARMNQLIHSQNFGVEIELTGITRIKAAEIIATHFDTGITNNHLHDGYDSSRAMDRKGRWWKCMRDASIRAERKYRGEILYAGQEMKCEIVTPILQYDDLEDLQEVIRKLRAAGAIANDSCGIHVHVDGANHTPASLVRLMNLTVGRQELIYEALEIGARANRWCKRISRDLLTAMKQDKVRSKSTIEKIWYSPANDDYHGGVNHTHYNETRYHGVNLHAFFTKGTVEFRLFNGTTHAGKIKAYVQLCLGMSAWAINAKDSYWFTSLEGKDKAKAFEDLLTRRLGLKGKEFETARYHLLGGLKNRAAA